MRTLLCPAWKRWGSATTVKPTTTILHSPADETVPFPDSQELLPNSALSESALIVAGTDHRLADPEALRAMVEAVERAKGNRAMKVLNIQVQPERVLELDETQVTNLLTAVGSGTGLVKRFSVSDDYLLLHHFDENETLDSV